METVTFKLEIQKNTCLDFYHANYVVKTDFFWKEQSYVNISYLLQQHTKLF